MNPYTVVYLYYFYYDDKIPNVRICRVWANDLDSVIKRFNGPLEQVHFVLEGHPEILTHTAEQIPTYDWGNPN